MAGVRVEILFCMQCRWFLRAGWYAQELFSTFGTDVTDIHLRSGSGGVFEVRVNDTLVWSRAEQGRFPEAKELKQAVRDVAFPDMSLGHADTPVTPEGL